MPTLSPAGPDFFASAPNRIVVERTVAAPAARIWDAITDTPGWTTWYPTMTSAAVTSDPGHGVGSTRSVKVGRLEADERFIVWEPERRWAFTIVKTNVPLAKRFAEQLELIPDGDVTTVRYTGAFEPHLIVRLFTRIVEGQIRTAWTAGLDGLADHLGRS